jgi:hypothetical protein
VDGNVVRGGTGGGRKSRVRKGKAPLRVDKDAVEASKDGRVLHVRPSKLTVQERDLEKAESVNEIIEGGSLDGVDRAIRLIAGGSDEVKVPQKGDGTHQRGEDLLEGGKEVRLEGMDTRPVDVDNGESEVIRAMGEGGSDGEIVNGVVGKLKKPVIPGCDDPARGSNRRFEHKGSEGLRKEGGGRESRNIGELSFL